MKNEITFSSLCDKEVICICDGSRLGYIFDLEMDLDCGCVQAFLIPDSKGFSFKRKAKYRVCREWIDRVGTDLILIRRYETVGQSKKES